MNLFECPRIDDAAGYVLRALPDSEAESYRHHVTECEQCEAKVSELAFVSHALYSAAPQLSAPPEIFDRVMVVVRAESELLRAAGASADRPVRSGERRSWFGLSFGRLGPLAAGGLAAILLALGLGIGALLNGSDSSCSPRGVTTVQPGAGAGASAALKVCKGGAATMALVRMQAPRAGQTYQLWVDHVNDRLGPQPAGVFGVQGGRATVNVADLRRGDKVLVTREPAPGGSQVPTMQPLVTAAT